MAKTRSTHASKLGGKSKTILPDYKVSAWEGLNTYIKDLKELTDGQSPDSLNWITGRYGDHIELRRGYALIGATRLSSPGRVTGLGVGSRADGKQQPVFTNGRKVYYFNNATGDIAEVNTVNSLPAAASSDDVSIMNYENLAGSFLYLTSPNSSIYKIHTMFPADIIDLLSTAFRGIAKVGQSRMFMWARNDTYNQKYPQQLIIGVVDKQTISGYTQTTAESGGMGDGSTKAFSGTAAAKTSNGKVTVFNFEAAAPIVSEATVTGITAATQAVVTVSSHSLVVGDPIIITGVVGMTQINGLIGFVAATTATTITLNINSSTFSAYSSSGTIYKAEYFSDNGQGILSSSLGGTGTVDYTTGIYAVTFNTAPLNSKTIDVQYYSEDATAGGIADFTQDGSVNGQGKSFVQFDGGYAIQAVFPFDQVEYCFHILKTWYLTLGTDDTMASNLPYRSQLGLPYFRAGFPTDDGIVFLDLSNPALPQVQVLEIDSTSSTAIITVVPSPLSELLDLTSNGFTQAVVRRWGDYDLLGCSSTLNGVIQPINTVTYIRNIYSGAWDKTDYAISCLEDFEGALIAGDSLSDNVFVLFSGFDDDGVTINNYYTTKQFNLGVEGIKRTNRFVIRGLIQRNQSFNINFAYDSGSFITLFTVDGNASYVNVGTPVTVGSVTVGSQVVGGGGDVVTAYPYEVEFTIASDLYEYVQIQFQALGIGYVQIDEYTFKDNRYKGRRILPSRTV